MVVWLIGLSGSGKTTLAQKIIKELDDKTNKAVLIDGDVIRDIFGNDLGYSIEDRLLNAQRICQLCKFLDEQGVIVICAILSMFPETREWNRENIKNYYEVFIDSPIDKLIERDSKGLYGKYLQGKVSNVAGMDLEFQLPKQSDLVINNIYSKSNLLNYADRIIEKILQ